MLLDLLLQSTVNGSHVQLTAEMQEQPWPQGKVLYLPWRFCILFGMKRSIGCSIAKVDFILLNCLQLNRHWYWAPDPFNCPLHWTRKNQQSLFSISVTLMGYWPANLYLEKRPLDSADDRSLCDLRPFHVRQPPFTRHECSKWARRWNSLTESRYADPSMIVSHL